MSDSFTTGEDATLDIYDPQDGSFERIDGLTNFEPTARTTDLESHPNDGSDLFDIRYQGWNLSFDYDRQNSKLDRYFAAREARQRAGLPKGVLSITQTIRERDGSITQFRFTGVELKQDSTGSYKRAEKTTGKITGMAGRREIVG